jgi:hypothetical protein
MKNVKQSGKQPSLQKIILEQDDYDFGDYSDYGSGYGGSYTDSSTQGSGKGLARITSREALPGLLMSPVVDVANAFKKFGAKVGIKAAGIVVSTLTQAIAAVMPFNNPLSVDYVDRKFRFWDTKALGFIEKQFEKETALMRQGWETFKTDFWGLGFVASPYDMIAAAITAEKGIDASLSVLNVITGGYVDKMIAKVLRAKGDPGTLKGYIQRHSWGQRAQEFSDSTYYSDDDYNPFIRESSSQDNFDSMSLPDKINLLKKELGEEEANKVFGAVANDVMKSPEGEEAEKKWVSRNLPLVAGGLFTALDKDLKAGVVPGVSLPQIKLWKRSAGSLAEKAVTDVIAKSKVKITPPDGALEAVKTFVDRTVTKP